MVLSAAAGAGHISAAEAMVAELRAQGAEAEHVEALQYTNKLFRKLYGELYIELVNHGPALLGMLYDSMDKPWRTIKRRTALSRLNTARLVSLIKKNRPDYLLCTHFMPAEVLTYLKRHGQLDAPIGIVVTDIDAHAMWLFRETDRYFVAHDETYAYLSALGVPESRISLTGIPISPRFAEDHGPRDALRRSLGLDPGTTTLLVSAGGFGVGPLEGIVSQLSNLRSRVQIVAICGRNEALLKKVRSIPAGANPVHSIGYTKEMHRWMAASDLIVGKPGGLTSSEALAMGLVMVIVNPVPGQEERNSDHYLEEGVAIRCNNLPTLAYKVERLISDQARMGRMREASRRLGKPRAASDIARHILSKI